MPTGRDSGGGAIVARQITEGPEIRNAVRDRRQDAENGELLLTPDLERGRTPRPNEILRGVDGAEASTTPIEWEEVMAVREGTLVPLLAGCGQV